MSRDRVRRPVVLRSGEVALTASVLTHPRRARSAQQVADQDPHGVFSLVLDPEPDGPPTAVRTALAAWSAIDPAATHHLIVQDDMILSAGFLERAARAATAMPEAALSFFTLWDSRNGGAVRLGALAGAGWASAASEYAPTAAILLPRAVAAGFAAFAENRTGTWPDDILLHQYLRHTRIARFVAVPNAAEHADLASLAGNHWRGPRRSACWPSGLPAEGAADAGVRLEGMSAIPFIKYGKALCSVRQAAEEACPRRWHDIPTERYLSGLGIAQDRLHDEFRSSESLSAPIAREVWLTGFALGVAARADRSAVVSGTAAPDPKVVAEAMATIGPGGLCHRHSEERIAELRDALADTAWHGLRLGGEYGARIRDGRVTPPTDPEISIEVTGGDTALRDCVIRGLLDHGRRVTIGDGRSAEVVIDPTRVPAGEITMIRNTTGHTSRHLIRVGDIYGPGCPPESRIGAIVFAAAMGVPHTVTEDPATLVHPLHVEDLINALNQLVHDCVTGTDMNFTLPQPYRLDEIAHRIHRAVRPIPITFTSGATQSTDQPLPDRHPDDECPGIAIDFGLRTYSQWLAYEYSPTSPQARP